MLYRSALSTQDETTQLLRKETQTISERVHEARCEYFLAKQDWEHFVYALGAFSSGISPADGALIVTELVERERNTLFKIAEGLQELYDRNQLQEKFVA